LVKTPTSNVQISLSTSNSPPSYIYTTNLLK
jgi:hypothetical protein